MAFLSGPGETAPAGVRRVLDAEVRRARHEGLVALGRSLETAGTEWTYHPADPLARRIHHVLADELLAPGSCLEGVGHLAALEARPVVIIANHLILLGRQSLEVLRHLAAASRWRRG